MNTLRRFLQASLRIPLWGLLTCVLVAAAAYLYRSGALVPHYYLRTYFGEAEVVSIGSRVRLDGLPVGKVRAIELAPGTAGANPERKIEIVLSIERRYQPDIRSDASATLLTQGVLGGAM